VTPTTRSQFLVGAGVVVLALIVGFEATRIPVSPMYSKVGPTVFPYAVAAALLLLGLKLVYDGITGQWGNTAADDDPTPADRRGFAWLALGLVLNVALIDVLGFIIASTILFICVARAFGSGSPRRDLGIGFALALVSYLGFDRLLGIQIGAGILEGIL
jgi:putative tricarboxylic transport membrane protein